MKTHWILGVGVISLGAWVAPGLLHADYDAGGIAGWFYWMCQVLGAPYWAIDEFLHPSPILTVAIGLAAFVSADRALLRRSRLVLLAALLVLTTGCFSGLCGNEQLSTALSPGGDYVATVFERNCGATTDFVRVVMLRTSASKFEPERDQDWVYSVEGQPSIEIRWADTRTLEIRSDGEGRRGFHRETWKDVQVAYR